MATIYEFFLVYVLTRVISCGVEDEEASHYEMHKIFCSGDDGFASLVLDSVRSGQNVPTLQRKPQSVDTVYLA